MQLSVFFEEASILLGKTLESYLSTVPDGALADAVKVNQALLKRPFALDDVIIETNYDVVRFYDKIRRGVREPLDVRPTTVCVERSKAYYDDLNTWCREVVWWGNKKGAYLYGDNVLEKQLAGHY